MKLSQLRKRYPKAFDKWYKWNIVLNCDVRDEWKRITDFMDGQGIYITMEKADYTCEFWHKIDITGKLSMLGSTYNSRKQAETKAICKAFEILEGRL